LTILTLDRSAFGWSAPEARSQQHTWLSSRAQLIHHGVKCSSLEHVPQSFLPFGSTARLMLMANLYANIAPVGKLTT